MLTLPDDHLIVDAFYHPRLGVVLIVRNEWDELYYLRTDSDGNPAYLQTVTAHLQEHFSPVPHGWN